MASLGKLFTLLVVILVAATGDAQVPAPAYFSLYGSPSVNTYTPPKAPSPAPSVYLYPPTYPSPPTYPPSPVYAPSSNPVSQSSPAYPATNYPNAYPPASYPSNVYSPPATAYSPPSTGYSPPATGYNPAQSPYNYVLPNTYNQGLYSGPLAPQYVTPYTGYPSAGYNYNYNYNPNANCTDQSCKPTECCEFNGKKFACVEQNQDLLSTEFNGYGVYCARAKRCYSNGDCPANHCCVIRLDIPYDSTQYGSQNSYGAYGSYGNYGSYAVTKTERGECLLYAAANSTCRRPVDGSATSSCPCVSGTVCTFSVINPLTGICKTPSG